MSESKRWVLISPNDSVQCCLVLGKAVGSEQLSRVGNQTGGRVFLFLYTDNFWHDYYIMRGKGINFVREPSEDAYGRVAVFEDLYGNLWDLIERKK